MEKSMSMSYAEFLKTKPILTTPTGIDVDPGDIHPSLFPFQRDICCWALRQGRSAVFADTGLGKTRIQLEWARHIGARVLIVCPLSIADQTQQEGEAIELDARYVRNANDVDGPGIYITNYEMVSAFSDIPWLGMVLDESSILKSVDGKTQKILTRRFAAVPYKLCCTATPAPNDVAELAQHSAFLGIMTREQMLSTFFVHDDTGWRMRGHARDAFYQWMASWAMALKNPADLGYDGSEFVLPDLRIEEVVCPTTWRKEGELFAGKLQGITDRASVRQRTMPDRVANTIDLVRKTEAQCVVWCGLNAESTQMTKGLGKDGEARELKGSQSPDEKIAIIRAFKKGEFRVLVTKPKIAGRGLNFQNASRQFFVGISDSWEDYYQCIRRLWRYGQKLPVQATIIVSDHETGIVRNVQRKEMEATSMSQALVNASSTYRHGHAEDGPSSNDASTGHLTGENWALYPGDCCEIMPKLPENSVDLSVFSPPFLALYQYTGTQRDIGNCQNQETFLQHFRFVAESLLRLTKPGRICCMHLSQVPAMLVRDGYIGFRDFRGPMIQLMHDTGWIFHGEATIQKNPQAQAIRIKAKGLSFGQLEKDAAWMRPALADMLLLFRVPGENDVPIVPECTRNEWITWAHPVWLDIRETKTLNAAEGRDAEDDLHIHPLQLDFINRCIRLWSNINDTVFDPFAGIGSTGHEALMLGRKSLGIELKRSYVDAAVKNYHKAEVALSQTSLFQGE